MDAIPPPPPANPPAIHGPQAEANPTNPKQQRTPPTVEIDVQVQRVDGKLSAQYSSHSPPPAPFTVCTKGCWVEGSIYVNGLIDSHGYAYPYNIKFYLLTASEDQGIVNFPTRHHSAILIKPDLNHYDPQNTVETSCLDDDGYNSSNEWQISNVKVRSKIITMTYGNYSLYDENGMSLNCTVQNIQGCSYFPYHHIKLAVMDGPSWRCLDNDPVDKNHDGQGQNLIRGFLKALVLLFVSSVGVAYLAKLVEDLRLWSRSR